MDQQLADRAPHPATLGQSERRVQASAELTGLGAVAFRGLIGFVHNLLFLGDWSFAYDSRLFTSASPWGALVLLVPVLGGIGVTFIVSNFAPEAKGHGVPEVMDARSSACAGRRTACHAPEHRRRPGGNRCSELCYATMAT